MVLILYRTYSEQGFFPPVDKCPSASHAVSELVKDQSCSFGFFGLFFFSFFTRNMGYGHVIHNLVVCIVKGQAVKATTCSKREIFTAYWRKKKNHNEEDAQRGCRISILGDFQNSTGRGPQRLSVTPEVSHDLRRWLDGMTSGDPFLPHFFTMIMCWIG